MFSRVGWRCLESEDPREFFFDKKKNSSQIGSTRMQSVNCEGTSICIFAQLNRLPKELEHQTSLACISRNSNLKCCFMPADVRCGDRWGRSPSKQISCAWKPQPLINRSRVTRTLFQHPVSSPGPLPGQLHPTRRALLLIALGILAIRERYMSLSVSYKSTNVFCHP